MRLQLYFHDDEIAKITEVGIGNTSTGARALILIKLAEITHDAAMLKKGEQALSRAKFQKQRRDREE